MTEVRTYVAPAGKAYEREWVTDRLAGPHEVPPQIRQMNVTLKRVEEKLRQQGRTPRQRIGEAVDRMCRLYMERHGETYAQALAKLRTREPSLYRQYAAHDVDHTFDRRYRGRQEALDPNTGLPRENVPSQAEIAIARGEAGAEVHKLVLQMRRQYPAMSYEQALIAVLQGDPELAHRYRSFAGDYGDRDFSGA